MGELPQLSCIALRVLAEGLVWSGASGHGTGRGSGKRGGRRFGDLLSEVADPLLLLILGEGQEKHVPGRGHIVVYCWRTSKSVSNTSNLDPQNLELPNQALLYSPGSEHIAVVI